MNRAQNNQIGFWRPLMRFEWLDRITFYDIKTKSLYISSGSSSTKICPFVDDRDTFAETHFTSFDWFWLILTGFYRALNTFHLGQLKFLMESVWNSVLRRWLRVKNVRDTDDLSDGHGGASLTKVRPRFHPNFDPLALILHSRVSFASPRSNGVRI